MQTFTANEAKTRFCELLDRAQHEPIGVLKHDHLVGVMVSVHDFEAMRAFYADRLQRRLDESAQAAASSGMTPQLMDHLLADES